jgi:hypothetical protein
MKTLRTTLRVQTRGNRAEHMGQKGQEQGGEWGHCEREATIGARVLRVCVCEVGGGGGLQEDGGVAAEKLRVQGGWGRGRGRGRGIRLRLAVAVAPLRLQRL